LDADSPKPSAEAVALPPRRAKNLFVTFGTNIGILGLTFATGTLNARLLGPSGRGELAAIQTLPSFLGMLALLGLPSAVGYFSARRPAEARAFTLTAAVVCFAASLPAILVGYHLMPWTLSSQPASVIRSARIYLAFVALQAIVMLPYMALQGLGKFGIWNILRLAPNVAALISIVFAWSTGAVRSDTVSRCFLVCYGLIAPLAYAALWSRSSRGSPSSHSHRIRELLRYGLPSAAMIPAGLLNLQLDQMLLAAWLPSRLLGLYAVGVSWSGLISPVFGALGSVVFPTLAAATDADAQRYLVARSFRLAILIVTILGLGLAGVTPILLPLFFGASFGPAVPSALVLVAAGMILNLNNLCGELLRGLGVPRWPLYSQLVALPVTISSLLLLLPRWSILGAGVSSLLAYATAGWVCVIGIKRTCGLTSRELLLPKWTDCLALWDLGRRAMNLQQRR
jgi:O-antigen/teichoic acid export membrane protein